MGIWSKIKKEVSRVVNQVTGGNETANAILGTALAIPTGGASLSVSSEANKQVAAEAQKKADEEEQQRQNAALAANAANLNKNAEAYSSAVRGSATDATSLRGLLGDYDQELGVFDVWKRKRKL